VLQLTAAALVRDIVHAGRLDPVRPRLEQPPESAAGEAGMQAHLDGIDKIARCGARDEDRPAVRQVPDSVSAGRDALDPDRRLCGHRSPSRRAA